MFDLEITNATIVDSYRQYKGAISVANGKIAAISEAPLGRARQTVNADGLHVIPGMVDQHVHFMDPGETDREDFICGSSAAAVGGVTTVVEHTHGYPVRDIKTYKDKVDHLQNRSVVDFGLTAHVFPEDLGKLKDLWNAGALLFKIFTCTTHGIPTLTNDQLHQAFQELATFNGRSLVHCEDDAITEGNENRLREAGRYDNGIITEWRSEVAEEVAVANVALLSRLTGAATTIAHVSHPLVVDLIKREQEEGARIYAEVCPQYLLLNQKIVEEKGPFAKFTPPARSPEQSNGLLEMVNKGSIQILSSDHAPSTIAQKLEGTIWDCNFGLPGVETTLPMMFNLINENRISLQRVIQLYSEMPAKALGLYPTKGCIAVGADADLVLVDLSQKWVIRNRDIISKAGWTPFDGTECTGKPWMTIVRGNIIAKDGKIIADPGFGKTVNRLEKDVLNPI